MQAYCIRCKKKTDMKDPVPSTFKNGTPVYKGTCSKCGANVAIIVKKEKKNAPGA